MPGISITCTNEVNRSEITAAYKTLAYLPGYSVQEYLAGREIAVAGSGYEAYPIERLDDHNALIVIEGVIYNTHREQIMTDLQGIANRLISGLDIQKAVTEFVDTSDGDFLVAVYAKKQKTLCVFNDRWGKFPVFVATENNNLFLSRELKYLLHVMPAIAFNPPGMAEFVTFECNLDNKTILDGVKRLGPGSLVHAKHNGRGWDIDESVTTPVNFEPEGKALSRASAVAQYTELFKQGLAARTKTIRNRDWGIVADLSGGYDTRGVFAGLCDTDADLLVVHDRIVTADESPTAKKVAELYGKNLVHFNAEHPVDNIDELRKVTYAVDGLVNAWLSVSYFHDELEHNRSISGVYGHFMGLGGEFIRQIFQPKSFYRDVTAMLADDAITRFGNIDQACALLRLERGMFNQNLADAVGKLPETDPWDQLRHLYFDRYRTFDNCGENRHRLFHWTVTPYLAKDLFAFATKNIPARDIDHFFFFDFLKTLDPKSASIPRHGDGVRMDSKSDLAKYRIRRKIKEAVRNNRYTYKIANRMLARKLQRRTNPEESKWLVDTIITLAMNSECVTRLIHVPAMQQILGRSCDKMHLYQWLTLLLYMDEIEKRHGNKIKSS